MCRTVHKFFSTVYNTASDFSSSIIKSCLIEDDKTPIRSGQHGVEFLPAGIETMTFSLDHIKQIKSKLGVTLNDVISGTIFLGTRLYMETLSPGSINANSTSLVLLNTRMFVGSYKSIEEMVEPNADSPWGNHFAFLNIPVPKLRDAAGAENPLQFVFKARQIIRRKRMSSFAVYLTAKYLQLVSKFRGAREEKDFIDPRKLKSHIEHAFDMIFKAACSRRTSPPAN
ncbi:hypothetical protein POPTR_007G139501v4 [Populus trichocarpa]|uniref:O-acyltransferase WSD1 C-terminal domain-containing protein n=1 Tax=Populus trichocarpa TaxID=3694 RepID=A0A3N7G2N8_POPTR|nr:hypothetical protein POPTR_007G139501v4 [Populus trichocarpa]